MTHSAALMLIVSMFVVPFLRVRTSLAHISSHAGPIFLFAFRKLLNLSCLSAFSHNASADLVAWLPEFSSHACQAATAEHFSHGGRGMDRGGSGQDRTRVSGDQGGNAAARCASCAVAGPHEELGQEA